MVCYNRDMAIISNKFIGSNTHSIYSNMLILYMYIMYKQPILTNTCTVQSFSDYISSYTVCGLKKGCRVQHLLMNYTYMYPNTMSFP